MITTLLTLSLFVGQFQTTDLSRIASLETPRDVIVERAARRYRTWVYQTWRTDRREFDRRWRAGELLVERWRQSGQPEEMRPEVLEWFAAASDGSVLGGSSAALPALPEMKSFASTEVSPLTSEPQNSPSEADALELSDPASRLLESSGLAEEVKEETPTEVAPNPATIDPLPLDLDDFDAAPAPPVTSPPSIKLTPNLQGGAASGKPADQDDEDSLDKLLRDLRKPVETSDDAPAL